MVRQIVGNCWTEHHIVGGIQEKGHMSLAERKAHLVMLEVHLTSYCLSVGRRNKVVCSRGTTHIAEVLRLEELEIAVTIPDS